MKKVLMIVMLIIAMGLLGCPHRYYDRDDSNHDRGRYEQDRGRHDQDHGRDYEHRDRDNQDYGDHR